MEGRGGNDNKYRRAIKHKKKIQVSFLCPVRGPKTLDSAHYSSSWGAEIGVGEGKNKSALQFFTKNPLLLEQSS